MDRKKMPLGRPVEVPNLIQIPEQFGGSINFQKVNDAYDKLGAHENQKKVTAPNMTKLCARDLGYYRQTEEILNVLRDNERIKQEEFE